MSKLKTLLLTLMFMIVGVAESFAQETVGLDTADLAPITQSLQTAESWLSGSVLPAIIGLAVAALIIVIAKFAARKARPGG